MSEQYYEVSNVEEKRKGILEGNIQVLQLMGMQEKLDKIKEKKAVQTRKLRIQLNSINKNVKDLQKILPKTEREEPEKKEVIVKKAEEKKEEPVEEEHEMTALEKEIAELQAKIREL